MSYKEINEKALEHEQSNNEIQKNKMKAHVQEDVHVRNEKSQYLHHMHHEPKNS